MTYEEWLEEAAQAYLWLVYRDAEGNGTWVDVALTNRDLNSKTLS